MRDQRPFKVPASPPAGKATPLLAGLCLALTLGGCASTGPRTNPAEVGSSTGDWGGQMQIFGASTAQNLAAMRNPSDVTVNLGRRFAEEVPATVSFGFNSSILDPSAQRSLRLQAEWIRQFPEVRFRVFGHTDLVGSEAYNKALGLRRAEAVVAYLGLHGIARSRLEALVSYGKTRPLVPIQGADARNRRTVTEVSGLIAGADGRTLNGKYAELIYRHYVSSAAPLPTNRVTNQTTAGAGTSDEN